MGRCWRSRAFPSSWSVSTSTSDKHSTTTRHQLQKKAERRRADKSQGMCLFAAFIYNFQRWKRAQVVKRSSEKHDENKHQSDRLEVMARTPKRPITGNRELLYEGTHRVTARRRHSVVWTLISHKLYTVFNMHNSGKWQNSLARMLMKEGKLKVRLLFTS